MKLHTIHTQRGYAIIGIDPDARALTWIEPSGNKAFYTSRQAAHRRREQLEEQMEKTTSWTYRICTVEDLSATDLKQEAKAYQGEVHAFQVTIHEHAEQVQGVYLPESGRMGMAWGADATWADVAGLEAGIDMYVNDGEEWNRHN